jgi:putative sterol carrier protein
VSTRTCAHVASDAICGERFVVRRLLAPSSKDLRGSSPTDVEATFRNMGKHLEAAGLDVTVHFEIGSAVYALHVGHGASSVTRARATRPHLELITEEQTWIDIASGTLAPLDAVVTGKLRVRGDTRLGVKIIHQLAGTPGRIDIC